MKEHITVPHSDDLERAVLAAMLHFAEHCETVRQSLGEQDFYTPRNRELFEVLNRLALPHPEIDPLVARDACLGKPNALELLDTLEVHITAEVEAWCQRLRLLTAARRLTRAASKAAQMGLESSADPESFLDLATVDLMKAMEERDSASKVKTARDAIADFVGDIVDAASGKAPTVLPTGLRSLDGVLGGLEQGRLYVVAGRPGMGKSALAMNWVEAAAVSGFRCAVFSLEMSAGEVVGRIVADYAKVNARAIQRRQIGKDSMHRIVNAAGEVSELPIVFPESPRMTIEEIGRASRREKMGAGLSLIVVDYLQLVRSSRKHDSREQEVSEISRELKLLARELQVPVVAVAQLNREVEKRGDKRPMVSDLRESGSVEQDADAVILLYRDEYYNPTTPAGGVAEIIIGKQRGGSTGIVKVRFDAVYTRFKDLEA